MRSLEVAYHSECQQQDGGHGTSSSPIQWMKSMAKQHGKPFLSLLIWIRISEGFSLTLRVAIMSLLLSNDFSFSDHHAQILVMSLTIPFILKPIFGYISDTLFIKSTERRAPYLIIFSVIWTAVTILLSVTTSKSLVIIALIVSYASEGFISTVTDALVVEFSRVQSHWTACGDLQATSTIAYGAGGFIGTILTILQPFTNARTYFLIAAAFPLGILLLSLYFKQRKEKEEKRRKLIPKFSWKRVYETLQTPDVWRTSLWLFTSFAIVPTFAPVHRAYNLQVLEFTEDFHNALTSAGFIMLMVLAAIYNRYLHNVRLVTFLAVVQTAHVFISSLDLLLVLNWNVTYFGIPNNIFAFGDNVLYDAIAQFKWLPVFNLLCTYCPIEIEATFIAIIVSVIAAARLVGESVGTHILCDQLLNINITEEEMFEDFWIAITVRTICLSLPILGLGLIKDISYNNAGDTVGTLSKTPRDEEDTSNDVL